MEVPVVVVVEQVHLDQVEISLKWRDLFFFLLSKKRPFCCCERPPGFSIAHNYSIPGNCGNNNNKCAGWLASLQISHFLAGYTVYIRHKKVVAGTLKWREQAILYVQVLYYNC